MDAQLKAKWIEALRSEEYTQARHTLKDGKSLCCIGVGYVVCKGRRPTFSTTTPAANAIGLTHEQQTELTYQNDFVGASFLQIADYIEKHL